MSMSPISTISEFLLHAGTDYWVFDMGRSIRDLSSQMFLDIENGQLRPAYPRLEHAWFGIIFWDKTRSTQHYIWFVKLPLDEQGQIVAAARNHFLQIIIDALGSELENAESKNAQLPENPYSFIPNQHQLADFNSISRKNLSLGQSQFYDQALHYIKAPLVIDWQTVALQGLTDIAANHKDPQIALSLSAQLANYPQAVQSALLTSFENQPIDIKIVEQVVQLLSDNPTDIILWQLGLRSFCQSVCEQVIKPLIKECLTSELRHQQGILVVISGRLFNYLNDEILLKLYLEAVARADMTFALYQATFRDLVQVPSIREMMLGSLRWTDKSDVLTAAVGSLFSAQKTN